MQIPILVEPVTTNGYRATCGPPLAVSAEGATRDEAVDKLERLLRDRLSNGVEIVAAEVPARLRTHGSNMRVCSRTIRCSLKSSKS
jgi:hypothetical protein